MHLKVQSWLFLLFCITICSWFTSAQDVFNSKISLRWINILQKAKKNPTFIYLFENPIRFKLYFTCYVNFLHS